MGQGASARRVCFRAASAAGLAALGRALGEALTAVSGSHAFLLVALDGELGAGKTTLAAGAVAAMGVEATVASPTYGLVHPYRAELPGTGEAVEILHVDLYRLKLSSELDELGLCGDIPTAAAATRRVMLVEWCERAGGRLGTPDLAVLLEHAKGGRNVQLHAHSGAGADLLRLMGNPGHDHLEFAGVRDNRIK